MKGNVLYEVINNVAVLTVDNPPVNPLSEGVRNGFETSNPTQPNDGTKASAQACMAVWCSASSSSKYPET